MLPETVRILPLEQPPPPIRPKRKQLTLQKASLPVLSKVRHPQRNHLKRTPAQSLLSQASALAAGYDYDKAISLLQEDSQMASLPEVQSAIAQYETIRQSLVQTPISKLLMCSFTPWLSFLPRPLTASQIRMRQSGYDDSRGIKKILQTMYDKGYVLVCLHDCYETTDETGKL